MKIISSLMMVLFALPMMTFAQDAATEEQLNRLRSEITTLQESNVTLKKRLEEVARELQEVREQAAKPSGNFADAADVKRLAEAVKEVDAKRAEDREVILGEIKKLGASLKAPAAKKTEAAVKPPSTEGFEYTIQSGDTLSTIVAGCRKQGVKVTVDQILKANPGLKPESLQPGKKISIPAPTP
jgi:nucleoid-associated protein YgaU